MLDQGSIDMITDWWLSKIDQVREEERERIKNEYGYFNDSGCGCCSETTLKEELEKETITTNEPQTIDGQELTNSDPVEICEKCMQINPLCQCNEPQDESLADNSK